MKPLLILICLFLTGCVTYQTHDWDAGATFDDEKVVFIGRDKLSRVRIELLPEALELLETRRFAQLSPEEFSRLSQKQNRLANGEAAYLVRGVSWDGPPMYSIVAYDPASQALHVQQYTYSGEIYIPGKRVCAPNPVIAILDGALKEVYPTAIIGGDRIAAWSYSDKTWREY